MTTAGTIAIFGGGKMGEALLAGLLHGGTAPEDVLVVEKQADRSAYLTETYGVQVVEAARAAGASVLLVATKPQDVETLLDGIADGIDSNALVVSIAAGVTAARIEAVLPAGTAVVRCMPNTPALLSQGMSAIAPGTHARQSHLETAESLLEAVGAVVQVEESQLDAVTALSGSGPAYFFYVVEAMVAAGVKLGVSSELATQLVVQTAVGAAAMLRESGQSPTALREAVTSPGGTTAAAIASFDEHELRSTVEAAMRAAARRSAEIGSQNGAKSDGSTVGF